MSDDLIALHKEGLQRLSRELAVGVHHHSHSSSFTRHSRFPRAHSFSSAQEKEATAGDDPDAATEAVCHVIRGLKSLHSDLRGSVDRQSVTLRKKGRLLDRLQEQFAPEEGLIRQYLKVQKSIYNLSNT
jgi:hypothetical protein